MLGANRTPTFNLKVVLQETGLKADTVRAWERRYGLPQPERSGGGHRLYSEYDIQAIHWLITRQEEGLSISRAAELWHRLIAEGKDPAAEQSGIMTGSLGLAYVATQGQTINEHREAWLSACLAFDERRAEQTLTEAFAFYPPQAVCVEVLQRGLARIGEEWQQGRVTVQQEHFATALATRRLQALIIAASPPAREERILIACAPSDEHTFGPLLITFLLKRYGWDVIYLGANVPVMQLEQMLETTKPDLAVLSAQRLDSAAKLVEMAATLVTHRILVTYGGWIFNRIPVLRERIPGYFLGDHIEAVPTHIDMLLRTAPEQIEVRPLDTQDRNALTEFMLARSLIESDVASATIVSGIEQAQVTVANHFMGHDILAALRLRDISLIDNDIDWIGQLLLSREMPSEWLAMFLGYYAAASEAHLGLQHPLNGWFRNRVVRRE